MTVEKSNAPSKLGLLLSVAILGGGFVHFAWWILLRSTTIVQDAVPYVPFFGDLKIWGATGPIVVHLVEALALIAAGSALLMRARLAPILFFVGAWGATLLVIARSWPTEGLQTRVNLMLSMARNKRVIPEDATLMSFIPDWVVPTAVAVAVFWLAVLLVTTYYVTRGQRT